MCKQIIDSVANLHTLDGVAHCDIKGENMILDDDGVVKLIDFGHAELISLMTRANKGTKSYKAPEVSKGYLYSVEKADIHCLAVTLFTVLFQAFPDFSVVSNRRNPSSFRPFFQHSYRHFKLSDKRHPKEFLELLWRCFSERPVERPSISELQQAAWIDDAPSQPSGELLEEISMISQLHDNPNDN